MSTNVKKQMADLQEQMAATVRATQNSLGLVRLVGVVLVCVVGGYLFYLYGMLNEVKPDALAAVGRNQIENRLPAARAQLTQELKNRAPEVVQQIGDHLLTASPRLMRKAQLWLTVEVDKKAEEVEQIVYEAMRTGIENEAEVMGLEGGGDDVARFRVLIDQVLVKYEANVVNLMTILYDKYAQHATEVNDYLQTLQAGELLSERQKIHRELVHTWVVLLNKKMGEKSLQIPFSSETKK